ncbi:DUF6221 family protein [Acrocarpospora catenulata]|uniref:DUF6221 family protein n=1 Tax=Acrocarpospora catenulata TaxID=2836182 RepID=UPI001BDA4D05|nr:DUF6221 family protein [Acrocarpospora catenulata]
MENSPIAFLHARLEERERIAQQVIEHLAQDGKRGFDLSQLAEPVRRHVNLNDPASVLADVAVTRRILDDHGLEIWEGGTWTEEQEFHGLTSEEFCRRCSYHEGVGSYRYGWCPTVLLLALRYEGHEDFKEDWRVSLSGE